MDREEIKQRLQLCRPDHPEDREDPFIAEALRALEDDSELREWFEAQQAFDREMTSAMQDLRPPAGLKEKILSQDGTRGSDRDNVLPFPAERSVWRKPWLAAAAVVALLFALVVLPRPDSPDTPASPALAQAGVPDIVSFLADHISAFRGDFEKRDSSLQPLKAHLLASGAPAPGSIPGRLGSASSVGCVTFEYQGAKLGMICFKDEVVYHLVSANANDLDPSFQSEPQIFELENLTLRVWRENDQILFLVVQGTKEQLLKII